MRSFAKIIGAFLTVASTSANASQVSGYVTSYLAMGTGQVIVTIDGSRTSQPACSTLNRFAFNGGSTAGQALAALFLSAYTTRMPVFVMGSGDCGVWPDSETATYAKAPN